MTCMWHALPKITSPRLAAASLSCAYETSTPKPQVIFFQAEDGIRDDLVTGVQTCAFFFQAEDGIRDDLVTGVQTCALPIYRGESRAHLLKHVIWRGIALFAIGMFLNGFPNHYQLDHWRVYGDRKSVV